MIKKYVIKLLLWYFTRFLVIQQKLLIGNYS